MSADSIAPRCTSCTTSTLNVESVVYAPQNPVVTSRRVNTRPEKRSVTSARYSPMMKLPVTLISSVANGKLLPQRLVPRFVTRKRRLAPRMPPMLIGRNHAASPSSARRHPARARRRGGGAGGGPGALAGRASAISPPPCALTAFARSRRPSHQAGRHHAQQRPPDPQQRGHAEVDQGARVVA